MSDFSNPEDVLFRLLVTVDDVWVGLAALAFTLFVVLLACGVLFRNREDRPVWLNRLQKWQRVEEMNSGLFLAIATLCLIGAGLWLALLLVLVTGLISLLVTVPDLRPSEIKPGDFRFLLAQIAGLTAVLGAVVALPFTVIRLRLSQRQSQTAQAALFNTKITEAAADLHAMRQVSKKVGKSKWETVWEDDITRRNAAIDRLEGLVREEPQEAGRVSRLLSVHVRELSNEHPAEEAPKDSDPDALRIWARGLQLKRSNMEHAVQVLGRLERIENVNQNDLTIDLRGSNLQAMDLSQLNLSSALLTKAKLQGANFFEAKLQGADLSWAELQGAKLSGAELQGADLFEAELKGADLFGAKLQGANLSEAELQGADLIRAELQEAKLFGAKLQGASLIGAELQEAKLFGAMLQGAKLYGAMLQRADLSRAELQGATLIRADFDPATSLTAATFQGAAVKELDYTNIPQILDHLDDLFGDGSTKLPDGTRWPDHWPEEDLDWDGFKTQWRAWAKTKGVVIPD